MAGIDSIVNNLVRTFAGNPQGLQDRYAITEELFALIAMQKLKKDKEAAQRSLQMQMQPESGTVKDQLEDELMQATKQELASSLAPGLQQQGQMMQAQQMQQAMAGGLPTQPAPNMANMARGGIVGYKEGELVEGRRSGYARRQAEKEGMRERAGPEMQEFMEGMEENIGESRDWAAENPLEAASYAAAIAGGLPAIGRAGLGALRTQGPRLLNAARNVYSKPNPAFTARVTDKGTRLYPEGVPERILRPELQDLGPKALDAFRNLYSKKNPAFTARVTDKGTRLYPEGVPERLFSPGRTAGTGVGLGVLDFVLDMFGGEDEEQEENVASMLGEGIARTPPRLLPLPEETPLPSDAEDYVRLMQSPSVQQGLTERQYLDSMQRGAQNTTGASTPTPEAGIPSLVPPRTASMRQGTEKDIASMLGEDVAPMQRAAPTAPTDPRMSRYEDQLARLEAEEKDKLGSLIDFLLAAGASGGTNLGATLMGGGTGLQAREQRIKDEMARTIQNIETLQLERDKMAQSAEQATLDRELRDRLARVEADVRQSEGAAERALRADQFRQEFELREATFEEDKRQFGEDIALRNREASHREAANDLAALIRQDTLDRNLTNDEKQQLFDTAEALNKTVEALQLTPEAAAPYLEALNRAYDALGYNVTSTTAVGEDPEIEALAEQYKTPVAR
jgi:hypothetical protein